LIQTLMKEERTFDTI